jgi:hypothetical protein
MGNPLVGVLGDVWMAANPSIAATNETATNIDAGAWIQYQASVHIMWDPRVPVVVQCSPNGSSSWATVTDYQFQPAGGVIIFNTARVAATNNFVRISSGNYFNLTQLDDAHTWSLALKAAVADTTSFQATGNWQRNLATTKGGSGKIETYRSDGRIFLEIGSIVALQLYADKANNKRWDVIGTVTGLDPKNDIKGVSEQAMSFDITGGAYFRTS